MATAQQGVVYRYLRADSDHDISGDTLELSTDAGTTWASTGVTYIAPGSWPASVTAANLADPVASGYVGYWWRILTGPATPWPLTANYQVEIRGRLTDNPETPHFAWYISIAATE